MNETNRLHISKINCHIVNCKIAQLLHSSVPAISLSNAVRSYVTYGSLSELQIQGLQRTAILITHI